MASKKKSRRNAGPSIALHLPRDAQGLHTRGQAMVNAVEADTAHFANTYPPLSEVQGDLDELGNSLKAAEGGGPAEKTAVFVAEMKVRSSLGLLGKYAQAVVRAGPIEDAPAIISGVLMFVSNVGRRAPKDELEARPGKGSGSVLLLARAVPSAVAYTWEFSLDQLAWTQSQQTAQTRTTLTGLTPGKTYYFRFRALLRDGTTTSPSVVVSFMVQ